MSMYHTPYELTPQGRAETWTRKFVPGFQRDRDYYAWLELVGAKKANEVMREIVREERV